MKVDTASRDSAVLFTNADYKLSNDAGVLTITLNASLFPNSDSLSALKPAKSGGSRVGLEKSLYHNTLTFEISALNATGDRDTNIAEWSANGGAAMRRALNLGASKLAWLLEQDLQSSIQGSSVPPGDSSGSVIHAEDGTLKYVGMPASQ